MKKNKNSLLSESPDLLVVVEENEVVDDEREKFLKHLDSTISEKGGLEMNESSAIGVMFKRIKDVTPEGIINRLGAIADEEEAIQWEVGDLTNAIYERAKAAGLQYHYLDVCFFVAVDTMRGQRKMNTIKSWAITARRFPRNIREMYSEKPLSFSIFQYAGKKEFELFGSYAKRWQEILDYAIDATTEYHRVNLREVKTWCAKTYGEGSLPVSDAVKKKQIQFTNIDNTIEVPLNVPANGDVLGELENITNALNGLLPRIDTTYSTHSQVVAGLVLTLKKLIGQIRKVKAS